MSLSYKPLKPIKVVDPLLEVDEVKAVAVLEGPSQLTYKQFVSSNISSSSIQFTCNPPSGNTVIDRLQYVQIPVRLTFTGVVITTNGAFVTPTSLLNNGLDAPRKFALQSAVETLQVTINGDSVSQNMSDVIHPLSCYYDSDELRTEEYSMSPSMRDQSCNYADLQGTSRNPLANYGDSQQGSSIPRGAFSSMTVVSNAAVVPAIGAGTAATAVVDLVLCEPLFLSPFFNGRQQRDRQGFYNVTNMDFVFNMLANAGFRMWSHSEGAVSVSGANSITTQITSVVASFNNFSPAFSFSGDAAPKMLFKYLTPNLLSNAKLGPLTPENYDFFDVNRYVTDLGAITNASGLNQVVSNNIQMSTVPKKLYIFARPSNSVLQSRADITDCYLSIESISIQFENQSAILSSANKRQLYLVDQRNSNGTSWEQWSGEGVYINGLATKIPLGAGPLCLEFGKDIALNDPSITSGVNGQFQLQVTVGLRNQNTGGQWDALQMSLYLVTIQEGIFTIPSLGNAQHQIGVISKQDVLASQEQEGISYRDAMVGGDFFSTLRDIGTGVNDFLKKTKLISTVGSLIPHPIAQTIGTAAHSLGYGVIRGGAIMDREDLAQTLNTDSMRTQKSGGRRLMDR